MVLIILFLIELVGLGYFCYCFEYKIERVMN